MLRLQLTAAVLRDYVTNRGLLPLGDPDVARYAWKIVARQAGVTLVFQAIDYGVQICAALAAATLLGLDPLRGTAALLVLRFLLVGVSVKKSAEATRHRVVKATLDEACAKTKPDPNAPQNLAAALEQLLKQEAKKDGKPGEKN